MTDTRIPAIFIPVLEDCFEDGDSVCCDDIWEKWGVYKTESEAMTQMNTIVDAVRAGEYPIPADHWHSFCIFVYDDNFGIMDVIEVIDNIEED